MNQVGLISVYFFTSSLFTIIVYKTWSFLLCSYKYLILQDNYLEEALKMRNLLQEFLRRQGRRPPTILGLREHIFTGRLVSPKLKKKKKPHCDDNRGNWARFLMQRNMKGKGRGNEGSTSHWFLRIPRVETNCKNLNFIESKSSIKEA